MMAQLKNQNPMSPNSSDPTQYVTELAQFTSLEQQTNTAQSTAQSAQANQATQALALLGHTVSYVDTSGNRGTGVVQKVDFSSSGPTLTVSGISGILPSGVNQVS
jgi:flagellar basal-body rod modification protein FlgD